MEFYCESCETAMCLECTEGEHREHVTVPLRDVLEQHKSALKNQLDTLRNRYKCQCFNPGSIKNFIPSKIPEVLEQIIISKMYFLVILFAFLWQTTSADGCH